VGDSDFRPQVVVFACNWCSYAGADTAGVSRVQYNPLVRVIRVMCSGRVHPAFVFRAFAKGADGVLITGCHFGDCHYISGNERQVELFERVQAITDILGLDQKRVGLEWISAAEGERFGKVMDEFVEQVTLLGPAPKPLITEGEEPASQREAESAWACFQCGKCTGSCPVAAAGTALSPRRLVGDYLLDRIFSPSLECLSCLACEEGCPQGVSLGEVVAAERRDVFTEAAWGQRPHGGIFQGLARMMTSPDLHPRRGEWVPDGARVAERGKTLLYVGCAPYYDAFFPELGVRTLDAARGAVKILNHLGIEPVILRGERCCGHDAYWEGDWATFARLAALNTEAVRTTGAEQMLFTCPECLSAYRNLYPKLGLQVPSRLLHFSQYLLEHMADLPLEGVEECLTFQDPCRLSRHVGETEAPRKVLAPLGDGRLVEMAHAGARGTCCAATWMRCDAVTKSVQMGRLDEARATGARLLVTACPKCEIHLSCTQREQEDGRLELRDLTALVADRLKE
jgi:heterodisulfide reductase subunit D